MNTYLRAIALTLFLSVSMTAAAQPMTKDSRMADRYFENGEYDKAAVHYKKVYYEKDGVQYYYNRYFEVLVKIADYDELDNMINKAYKQSGGDVTYLVDLGYVNTMKGDMKAADSYYTRAIDEVPKQQFSIAGLAGKFINYNEIAKAQETYERGRSALNDNSLFNFELAYVYSLQSEYQKMIGSYLEELAYRPDRINAVESNLQRFLGEDKYDLLEATLLKRVQREPRVQVYQELLVWMYMNMNDYESAFIQARSIDINFGGNSRGILNLARSAANQEKFDAAIKAYQFLIDKGPSQDIFVTASLEMINVKRDKVVKSPYFTITDLRSLESSYFRFINSYQQNYTTAYATIELCRLEAFYIHNIDTAAAMLSDLLTWPQLNKELEARAKLDLGDYYLLKGEHWESTLLYGQVEKAFRESPLAEDAKLRNARLSYYKGDFEWAKTQLDILKTSTSELISNDAIELSVFIADNLNLDTTDYPMILFARADLMVYQNKLEEAVYELNGILKLYPHHSLTDDIYFKFAQIAVRQQKYEDAAGWLEKIVTEYKHDLLADNALYMLGEIYLTDLKDRQKAMDAFEKLIIEHQSSTFVVEARKKYRELRGDMVN